MLGDRRKIRAALGEVEFARTRIVSDPPGAAAALSEALRILKEVLKGK